MGEKLTETYSDEEARERAAATLKVMLATPHKPHKEKGGPSSKGRR